MKWVIKNDLRPDFADTLTNQLELPPILSQILVNRGFETVDKVNNFFYPKLDHLSHPFSIPGMEKGIDRLVHALKNKEKIVIFGDYDVDGITATSLLFIVFSEFGAQVSWHLPDRFVEGYGLSKIAIDKAHAQGSRLIVTVDCGITGKEEVEYANELGIETIISDHHEPPDELPDAYAIINPKLGDRDSATFDLAGVGVAFKLVEALYHSTGKNQRELYQHLDLVGLGTMADIVPLVKENRILAKYGLKRIASTNKPGLKVLLKKINLWGKQIETEHIIFSLAPRLNAVGRIGDASAGINLLTTYDKKIASKLADFMEKENRRRKKIDYKIFQEAKELIKRDIDLESEKVIVLANEGWHKGVIGIVASRIVEEFNRPTIILSLQDGIAKGSARSISEFHIFEAIESTKIYLNKYGGHKYAAGLSIDKQHIPAFREAINSFADQQLDESDLERKLKIDAELDANKLDKNFVEWLELFSPYGPQNIKPRFLLKNANLVAGSSKIVGVNHLKFKVQTPQGKLGVIGFNSAEKIEVVKNAKRANIVFVLEFNRYFGYPQIQLNLKDLEIV